MKKKEKDFLMELRRESLMDRGWDGDEHEYEITIRKKNLNGKYRKVGSFYMVSRLPASDIKAAIHAREALNRSRRGRKRLRDTDILVRANVAGYHMDEAGVEAYLQELLRDGKIAKRTYYKYRTMAERALIMLEHGEELDQLEC